MLLRLRRYASPDRSCRPGWGCLDETTALIDILARPVLRHRTVPNLGLLIAVTMTGTIAMHIFVPAMPAAAADLGVSPSLIQSTVTLYILGLAAGQLIYGPLSDRFGRRPVLLLSLAVYVLGLVLAIPVASVGALIGARILQSVGACGALVLGRAMVRDGSTADEAVRRLAALMIAMTMTPAIAPAVGGLISGWLGWRAIFALLAMLVAVLLAAVAVTLPETARTRLALPGLRSMIVNYGRLIAIPSFRYYLLAGTFCTTSIYAFLSASPFIFVDVLHRSIGEVGLYCMVVIGGITVGAALARVLAGRMSLKQAAITGSRCCLLGASALLVFELMHLLTVFTLLAPMVLYAIGMGLMSPNAVTGLMNAAPQAIGSASSLYGFAQMSFGALVTLIVAVWHDGSALPVAIILTTSAAAGQLALHKA
jgi:DHA1 family bicyclomycin/chloramphenicol resistance-like MFS transporter